MRPQHPLESGDRSMGRALEACKLYREERNLVRGHREDVKKPERISP